MRSLLFILFIAFFCPVFSQSGSYSFTGHVHDADTRVDLAGATVFIQEANQKTFTDSVGVFVISNLSVGSYTILIEHVDCGFIKKTISLKKNLHLDFYLPHSAKTLGEVEVTAKIHLQNTGIKKSLSGIELDQNRGGSISEALGRLAGVSILQTGANISKPVIHGLSGSRVLIAMNGIRQEGQQWGDEHAPEIDVYLAEKLFVIKGVDELKYGSDAVAGVVLVEPRRLRYANGGFGEFNTGYFTNDGRYVVSAIWEQQLAKLKGLVYRVQGTFKKAANYSTPDYRLDNTGMAEKNFSATLGWKNEKINTELFYSRFGGKVGIFRGSHIGSISDLQNAIKADRPDSIFVGEKTYQIGRPYQNVAHQMVKSKTGFRIGEHRFIAVLASQLNSRQEYDVLRINTKTTPQLNLSLQTFLEEIVWEYAGKRGFNSVAGLAAMQMRNTYRGRYFIPNYRAYTNGAYFIEKWHRHQWEVQAGIRIDDKKLNTVRIKVGNDTINHRFHYTTMAASGNVAFSPSAQTKLNFGINISSRAPYANELLSYGIHHGTATFERGNINLKPEQSTHLSLGIAYKNKGGDFDFEALFYSNNINNFIYLQPMPDSPILTIAGAFPLKEYRKTDARLSGIDITANWTIIKGLIWGSEASILFGQNKSLNTWLIGMPPNKWGNSISWHPGKINLKDCFITAEYVYVFEQKRVPNEQKYGRQDYKIPPEAYGLLNVDITAKLSQRFEFGIMARNLLNTRYQDYLNSMRYFHHATGINIGIRLKYVIETIKN